MVYFPVIEAYEARVFTEMADFTKCRVWAEEDRVRVGGDSKYDDCTSRNFVIGTGKDGPNDWYYIIVKTLAGHDDYYPQGFINHTCVCVTGDVRNFKIKAHIIDNIDKCYKDKEC
ncbi:10807_t:CDS:2 [Gigaspora margarita]|uniref:10807_t:CDS:1 n=1 Tax=Gigaspora margarita TaxID=4874 RepID=A0ABN7UNU1_GIGMA|nr:10807_t:CDS:2 [Gigaspora margarita]